MKVLVCGGRDYKDYTKVKEELDKLGGEYYIIIQGGAKGADFLAKQYALVSGWGIEEFKADWANEGKAAGPIRNRKMLMEGKPDLVVAFWDGQSRGTKSMIELAREANVPVQVVLYTPQSPLEGRGEVLEGRGL